MPHSREVIEFVPNIEALNDYLVVRIALDADPRSVAGAAARIVAYKRGLDDKCQFVGVEEAAELWEVNDDHRQL